MEIKEQIKRRVSIVDVVSRYVDLKPAGKYLKGLCPFHTEKTPSFFVMPERDTFSCFGCNTFGDIFSFVEEIENLGFREAMNFLIEAFNIEVKRPKGGQSARESGETRDEYVEINRLAMGYFSESLGKGEEGRKALDYLDQRGISGETRRLFALGYAPNRWDGLYNYLRKKSCNINKATELGLLIRQPNGDRVYDRFRGRIIFPILSESGTPIAFGGRTIFDDPAKYLNSPDTPLYKKSNHLYGFNLAKQAIREKKHSLLVEGYFDVVSLYQGGVCNVTASLGTALTESQIYLLKRFSQRVYIFYDSDEAGVNAALRGIEKMLEQNINPGIITLAGVDDGAKDPDDFIKAHGADGFGRLIADAGDGFRFLVHHIAGKYDLNVPEKKNLAVREVMTVIGKITEPIVRDGYTRMAADFFNVDPGLLTLTKRKRDHVDAGPVKKLDLTPAERIFIESLLTLPELIGEVGELFSDGLLSVLSGRNIIRLLLHHYDGRSGTIDYRKVSGELNAAERGEFRDIFVGLGAPGAAETPNRARLEQQIESSYLTFCEIKNKQDLRRLDQEIKAAERGGDLDTVRRLIEKKIRFVRTRYQEKSRARSVPVDAGNADTIREVMDSVTVDAGDFDGL